MRSKRSSIASFAARAAPGDASHDYVFLTPQEDIAEVGFVEEEFFIEGSANGYDTPAGQTATVISSGHPYRTRIVVRRPRSSRDFNGTVLLEWQNVTAGYDIDAHWGPSWQHFVRKGYAWVGVFAQRVGVHGPQNQRAGYISAVAAWEYAWDAILADIPPSEQTPAATPR